MNLGDKGCNERRSCHHTPAWQQSKTLSQKKNLRKCKLIYNRKQSSVCLGVGVAGKKGLQRDMRTLLDVMDVFTALIVGIASQAYTQVKIYQTVYFLKCAFIICQFYLNKAEKKKREALERNEPSPLGKKEMSYQVTKRHRGT